MRRIWCRRLLPLLCTQLLLAYPCALAHAGSEVDPRVREAFSILTEALQDTAEEVARLRQDVNSLGEAATQLQEHYAELAAVLSLLMSHYVLALDEGLATDQTLLLQLGDLIAALNGDDE